MKICLRDKMLVTWLLILGLTGISSGFLTGTAASLKFFIDQFQRSHVNMSMDGSSGENIRHKFVPFGFRTDRENPKTLRYYLIDLHNRQESHNHRSDRVLSPDTAEAAGISDYDNNDAWENLSEPFINNRSVENLVGKNSVEQQFEKKVEYYQNNETQKYIDDYKEIFYKLRDFLHKGIDTDMNGKNTKKASLFRGDGKRIDVSYHLPLPETKNYFEIRVPNVTQSVYHKTTMLLMELMRNKTKISSKNTENEIVHIDIDDERAQVTSRDLIDLDLQSTTTLNNTSGKQMPTSPDEAIAYFQGLFNEKDYGDLLKIIKAKPSNFTNKPNTQTQNFTGITSLPIIKNNGFHAEISTDYIHKNGDVQENKNVNQFINQQDQSDEKEDEVSESIVGTATTILNPVYTRINTTKLILQPLSKLPFSYHSTNTQRRKMNSNRRTNFGQKILPSSTIGPQAVRNVLELNPVETAAPSTALTNQKIIKGEGIPEENMSKDITVMSTVSTVENETTPLVPTPLLMMHQKDWMNISELHKNTMNEKVLPALTKETPSSDTDSIPQDTASLSVMQAANWILEMKKSLQEEEKKKNERYKNYIKQFLGGDSGSAFLGKENGSSVMKINRQDNTLEELKLLMVEYFSSMNFIDRKETNKTLEVESIMNATNIFELMKMSSQLAKSNLQMKTQINKKEPSGFVKRVMESQVEKCSRFLNNSFFSEKKQITQDLLKKNNNRRFVVFTKCINFKLQRCIKGFNIWLEKGRFYLRPQFQLRRAYENYEIERNLYCLRTYNASSLDSNIHKVRVRPRYRKPAGSQVRGKNKTRLHTRRLSNGKGKDNKNGRNINNSRQRILSRKIKQSRIQQNPISQKLED
uniref:Uncharacterized protein n=1 Tax=Graphocephala atropunctata TaxID=36148 RepID=A0A1B6LFJ5_9HEMI